MTIDELLAELKKLNIILTGRDLANIWGMSEENVSRMKSGNKVIKAKYLELLEKKFDINLIKTSSFAGMLMTGKNLSFTGGYKPVSDIIKIPYWEELPEEMKHPEYNYVLAQRVSIENAWGLKADKLRIVPMVGDKMTHYWYPIYNRDILIIDMSKQHITGNGVYFAVSQNNTRFWVREMQVLVNNDVEFKGFAPSGNTIRVVSQEDLQKVGFKIIGKVIKNVSFRL